MHDLKMQDMIIAGHEKAGQCEIAKSLLWTQNYCVASNEKTVAQENGNFIFKT